MNMEIGKILLLTKGNPGALAFLSQLAGHKDESIIVERLEKAPSIRGTNIYVLWSDLCNKNIEKVVRLCQICPTKILEDACSRQDYSGRELVKEYLS